MKTVKCAVLVEIMDDGTVRMTPEGGARFVKGTRAVNGRFKNRFVDDKGKTMCFVYTTKRKAGAR